MSNQSCYKNKTIDDFHQERQVMKSNTYDPNEKFSGTTDEKTLQNSARFLNMGLIKTSQEKKDTKDVDSK